MVDSTCDNYPLEMITIKLYSALQLEWLTFIIEHLKIYILDAMLLFQE